MLAKLSRRLLIISAALTAAPGLAEEGLWTLDNLPRKALADGYNFAPDQAWVDKLQRASVRLAGGCSGAFVSNQGLVLTNHHCVSRCIAQLSSRQDNLLEKGFVAHKREDEAICPEIELNQLESITDVTGEVEKPAEGLSDAQAKTARKAAMASLESNCAQGDANQRCDVVSLYEGGRYHLYRYRRYQDVRLVFAPETAIAAFGGDPDNFSFPRYALDMALLRAYRDGQAVEPEAYFSIKPDGAAQDELVFVTGHPGSTQRSYTVAQLTALRDVVLPQRLTYLAELRGVLRQFMRQGSEQTRMAQREYFAIENALKAYRGRHAALSESGFIQAAMAHENALRERVAEHRQLRKTPTPEAWTKIAQAQEVWRDIYTEYSLLESLRGYQSDLLSIARHLVRAAQERSKPNAERLHEYTDAALPQLTQRLFSAAPIHAELEILTLDWSLEKLREQLGPDHPAVVQSLGNQSPRELARSLIENTQLNELAVRKELWDGGAAAIAASNDPLIAFVRRIDSSARAVRARVEREVEAVVEANATLISRARFELDGTNSYPDVTFSLRLSYGQVKGWKEAGQDIFPTTTVGGLIARSTAQPPFALPALWIDRLAEIDLATPFNFVTTHDIIGGNSGSPMLNRQGQLVGLIFDGNLHSLGGAYAYDGRYNRAVAVHPAIMQQALSAVYQAQSLVDELFPAL
ncbi:peptidase S46 [Oceanococcus atlanticus]|uniref:Dipeptidyl-peptidase n=1 Tax=Oceanococcus atlanticus TaxID=1317117 RepID=A0A1Y1SAW4_9GAMM|nr:S46 family peptidase [Oceanococcus atlanticus]ORE85536.1 peptidase S46 [Oceanococcus atlanticus]